MGMFFWRGKGGVHFVPTIAGTAGPTVAEITAGIDISAALTAVSGFTTQLNRVGVPVLSSSTEEQIDGPQQFVDSSVTCIDDDGSGSDAEALARQAAATTMVDGATGYFVFSRTTRTLAAGAKVFVFPGKVGAQNPAWTLDANVAASEYAIVLTGAARKNVAVLA